MGPAAWWLDAHWTMRLPALGALVVLGMLVYAAGLAISGFRVRDFSRKGVE
jgi:hypothetical protein